MSDNPFVSVIVPNYNHAQYLDQRLKSVLNQTYRNIEVIILDDCSTDNSLEVINKYISDSRISGVYVNEKNSGNTFLQWDKGLHLAKGELVWIAESDDYCELNMLDELILSFKRRNNTLLAYCTPELFNELGEKWERTSEGRSVQMSSKSYIRKYLINQNWPLNASCCLFRHDVALSLSNRYQTIEAAGDYMFWAEFLCNKGTVSIVNQHLSKWRIHSDSVTPVKAKSGKIAIADKEIFDYLCSKVHIGNIRKRYAIRYHISGIPYHGIESEETLQYIYSIWNYEQVSHLTFMDRVYNMVNELLFRFCHTKLSY